MDNLDKLCRFCVCELDILRRKDIFSLENSHLMAAATQCIALPMSADDRYPNFMCYPCADKLNNFAEFQLTGMSAIDYFDKFLLRNETCAPVMQNSETAVYRQLEELDSVREELSSNQDARSDIDIKEEMECSQNERNHSLQQQERPKEFQKCFVVLTRCDAQVKKPEPEKNVSLVVNDPAGSQHILDTNHKKTTRSVQNSHDRGLCKYCGKTFIKAYLATHEKTHLQGKPYHCKLCSKRFVVSSSLDRHRRQHIGEKPFRCDYCKKRFPRRAILAEHIRTHTGEKPHKCQYCQKGFPRREILVEHERIHTGEKPLKCDYCHQQFRGRSALFVHIRTHTGEKPHKCEHCPKSFSHKWGLVQHLRVHTGEKPFRCDVCHKGFQRRWILVKHERTHGNAKPLKCDHCPKGFKGRAALIRHIRIHTSENRDL